MVVGGIVGLSVGAYAGFWLGERIEGKKQWVYWLINAAALVLGVAAAFGGLYLGAQWLFVGAIGFEGGALTGLKYGYGRSVGVWAVHDRLTGNDKDLPRD